MKNITHKLCTAGFSLLQLLLIMAALAIIAPHSAMAADLEYTSLPQTGDSELILRNKQAVAATRLEFGNSYLNVATTGTNNIAGPVVLDRVVVGTAGVGATLSLLDVTASGTTTIATMSTAAQASLSLGVRVSGTLRAITSGTASVTLSYR